MKKSEIIKNIAERLGISDLNEMQRAMESTDDRDIILLAPTGSGKTLAFTIRMLRNIDMGAEGVSAVVVAPSRELVLQLAEVVKAAARPLRVAALYGGHSMADEVNSLTVAPDIVIATPGRLVDHLKRETLSIANAKSIVLDEYDKSLELGFLDEMRRIVRRVRRPTLRMLTSATRLNDLPDFMGDIDAYRVFDFAGEVVEPTDNTRLVRVDSPSKDKLDTLVSLLRSLDNQKTIVFVNHRESAERVYARLRRESLPAGLYHGGLEQYERRLAVELLANGTTPILVSTDLASRGLDIPEVGSVIHYHMPLSAESWTHRNGRTARQGASGAVYAILAPGEEMPQSAEPDETLTDLAPSADPIVSHTATLFFNAGKREKISKGDIAGYLIQKGGLDKSEVGRIVTDDHNSVAAIPRAKVDEVIAAVAPHKIKNKRVKVTEYTGT